MDENDDVLWCEPTGYINKAQKPRERKHNGKTKNQIVSEA